MIRVRFYRIVLSLPFIIMMAGVAYAPFGFGSTDIRFNLGMIAFAFGLLLQVIFALAIACPRCGKSPYAIGPSIGPFAFAGKPIPDTRCSRCGHDYLAKQGAERDIPPDETEQKP